MHRIKALIGDTQCPPLVAQGNNPEISAPYGQNFYDFDFRVTED